MTYRDIQQYNKDRIFHTKDGEAFDVMRIKAISGGLVEFADGFRMTLRKIDCDDLIRAINAVQNHFGKTITEIEIQSFEKGW